MDYQLDLTAYRCPLPLLMTQKALKGLVAGDSLSVQLNTDSRLTDFVLLAKEMGLKVEQGSGMIRFSR